MFTGGIALCCIHQIWLPAGSIDLSAQIVLVSGIGYTGGIGRSLGLGGLATQQFQIPIKFGNPFLRIAEVFFRKCVLHAGGYTDVITCVAQE